MMSSRAITSRVTTHALDELTGSTLPRSLVTGELYQGKTAMVLILAAREKKYTTPYWLTRTEIYHRGGQLPVDAVGINCTLHKQWTERNGQTGETFTFPCPYSAELFNLAQVTGIPHPDEDQAA